MGVIPMERRLSSPEMEVGQIAPILVSPKTLGEMLDVKVTTLQEWRDSGYGPEWFKLGRLVRYRLDAVLEWVGSLEVRK